MKKLLCCLLVLMMIPAMCLADYTIHTSGKSGVPVKIRQEKDGVTIKLTEDGYKPSKTKTLTLKFYEDDSEEPVAELPITLSKRGKLSIKSGFEPSEKLLEILHETGRHARTGGWTEWKYLTETNCVTVGLIYRTNSTRTKMQISANKGKHEYKYTTVTKYTCEKPGKIRWKCVNCGDYYYEETPAAHTWGSWAKTETMHSHICKVCKATEEFEHTFKESKDGKTATCTVCGYKTAIDRD